MAIRSKARRIGLGQKSRKANAKGGYAMEKPMKFDEKGWSAPTPTDFDGERLCPRDPEVWLHEQRLRLRQLAPDGLLIGRRPHTEPTNFGFVTSLARPQKLIHQFADDLIIDRGEGHMMTIAPTGAGKGVNVVNPAVLGWHGPSVIVDPKGECFRAASSLLSQSGHQVVLVDFYGEIEPSVCGGQTIAAGSMNVMESLDPASATFANDCFGFANDIPGGQRSLNDMFWDNLSIDLDTGAVGYICTFYPKERRNLFELRDFLCDYDLDHKIAVILDTELRDRNCFISQSFKTYLGHEREKVRTSVRSTAVQHLASLSGDQLRRATSSSSFDFQDVVDGKPLSIFLVVPPHRIQAASMVLRLVLSTLLGLITRRRVAPPLPTLFVLDELAQLGSFPSLRPLITLMRGYGARAMLMLQDVSQLRQLYPADYPTIINNCAILSTFGHASYSMSRELADLLGDISADQLFGMTNQEMAVRLNGRRSEILTRLNYLKDPLFAGLYGQNPMARRYGLTSIAAEV
jgi:type IV secretion system protein VirD4